MLHRPVPIENIALEETGRSSEDDTLAHALEFIDESQSVRVRQVFDGLDAVDIVEQVVLEGETDREVVLCLLYTSPSPRDRS